MKTRVWTAAVAMPLVLGAVFCAKPWPLFALACLCFWIGWAEYCGMASVARPTRFVGVGLGTCLVCLAAWFGIAGRFPPAFAWLIAVLCVLGCGCSAAAARGRSGFLVAVWSCFWAAAAPAAVMGLHGAGATNEWWRLRPELLLVLLPLWAGDSAAIFVGRACGRHFLAPKISPRKTVEGAVANLLACILLGWAAGTWVGVGLATSLASGLICGVLGQGGDLFESYLKRSAGVKDSGNLLPGHGGLLDRVDSLLFSAPFVLLLLAYLR